MARLNLLNCNLKSLFKFFIFIWTCSILIKPCIALFEDQVGKFDWQQQNIGAIASAHFVNNSGEQSPSSLRIVVASHQNVIASINPKSSQINWRKILEEGNSGSIKAFSIDDRHNIISVTGLNPLVRSWDANSGRLNWETNIADNSLEGAIANFYSINKVDQTLMVIDAHEAAFVQIKWYNYRTGELISSNRIPAPWFHKVSSSCKFISLSYFICVDSNTKLIYSLHVANKVFQASPIRTLGIKDTSSDIKVVTLIDDGANEKHLFAVELAPNFIVLARARENGVEVITHFENINSLTMSNINDETVIFTLSKNTENDYILKVYNILTNSYIESLEEVVHIRQHQGEPEKMFVHIIKKEGEYSSYCLLVVTKAHSLLLLIPGKTVWAREEALASILTTEFVDLPVSESEAQMEEQFGRSNVNIFLLSYKRITTQLLHLQNYLMSFFPKIGEEAVGISQNVDSTKLIRDDFNIHKIIIAVTAVGKIFGIDNLSGKVIWQNFVPDLSQFERYGKQQLLLFVQRTSTHYAHSPQCIVLGRNKQSNNGVLYTFNPINGEPLDGKDGVVHLNYPVIQASQLPFVNEHYLRGILLIDDKYKVHVYPESTLGVALQHQNLLYIFIAEAETGELRGMSLGFSTSEELIAETVWSLSFPQKSQTITNVVMKRNLEHVHSQGRVMGDRSVLYKYLNPNLAVVTTEGYNPVQKSTLNVFLVDVVSGKIVFSSSHKRAKGPVHVVHSENWIMYSYFSEKNRRTEVAILELYEGKTQSNTTAFSSLSPPPSPMIEQKAYIFPTNIDAVTVTITEKGITNKHLLFAIPSGSIVELPKAFLDPRRSLFPTQELREEGVMPYNPELPLASENVINYYQSVYRIRGIYTTPTGLESTCLVLAYGLDLFFTRVTPSHTFDILKDDFDHWLIVTVLSGLIGASYLTKILASRKALKQAWK